MICFCIGYGYKNMLVTNKIITDFPQKDLGKGFLINLSIDNRMFIMEDFSYRIIDKDKGFFINMDNSFWDELLYGNSKKVEYSQESAELYLFLRGKMTTDIKKACSYNGGVLMSFVSFDPLLLKYEVSCLGGLESNLEKEYYFTMELNENEKALYELLLSNFKAKNMDRI